MNASSTSSYTSSSFPPRLSAWDTDSDDDEFSHHVPSAQPHPSSSRFNASPEPEPFPPFSVAHLLQVASLDVYARKVVQGAVKDRLHALKLSSRSAMAATKKRVTGAFEKELGGREIAALEGKKREQAAVWEKRLRKSGKEWRQEKKEALLEQVLKELIREGEVFVVESLATSSSQDPFSSSFDATPTPNRFRHHSFGSSFSKPSSSRLYLPIHLPTLGPLLLHLLRIELDRLRASSTHKAAGIRAPPIWVSTETLVRRLQGSHEERWHFVGEMVVGAVMEALDDEDWVEESKGRGWRCVG